MKWILLLAIIPIIQYGEVAGYPPILKYLKDPTPIKEAPIKEAPADRNKLKCPEGNCDYCHLNDIIRAAYEASRKEGQQTDYMYPGYPGSSFDEPFEDIFPCRSARSPRVELTPYLTNSFDDNLAKIKIKLNILEENYKFINEFLQKAEANEKKEQQTDQISLLEESNKYVANFYWIPWTAESILSYWPGVFDNDIDDIKHKLELLKIKYKRVIIDNLIELDANGKKEQQTNYMFEHHRSLFDEPIKDMIQSRSTRSTYLTNSFNDALARIRITLGILESNYKYMNEHLKQARANEEKGQQTDQLLLIEESSIYIPYFFPTLLTEESSILSPWTRAFDNDIAYIENELELLKTNYDRVVDNIKKIKGKFLRRIYDIKKIKDSTKANSQKDKKDPSPSESIVSNNNIQENVTQTIPTPDESTNTQKPVPAKHDDKKDKLVGEKDPLHIPEIAPNNKTPENVRIIPVESTTIEKLESTTIKNDKKPEQVEQEAKKDTFVSIKNDNNEKVESSIPVKKVMVLNPLNPILLEELKREIAVLDWTY